MQLKNKIKKVMSNFDEITTILSDEDADVLVKGNAMNTTVPNVPKNEKNKINFNYFLQNQTLTTKIS